jgi:hypothetical protein
MSERRALEFNFVQKLRDAFAGSEYGVVESNTYEERKIPCIIVVAGESQPLVDHPEAQDNFRSELNVIIMSSSDEESPEEHMNVVDKVRSVMLNKLEKNKTKVKFLYIYNIYYQSVRDMREERRFATDIVFEVHYNYNSNPSVSQ